jgi:hypothetical protein
MKKRPTHRVPERFSWECCAKNTHAITSQKIRDSTGIHRHSISFYRYFTICYDMPSNGHQFATAKFHGVVWRDLGEFHRFSSNPYPSTAYFQGTRARKARDSLTKAVPSLDSANLKCVACAGNRNLD